MNNCKNRNLNKRNLLVTGGAGFIGSNFIHYLLLKRPNWNIVNLDLLTYSGDFESLIMIPSKNYTFIKGDICDHSFVYKIISNSNIDTIIHFAAETHVDRSIETPVKFIKTNVLGTFNLLDCAKSIWERKGGFGDKLFHHISTDEVYGSLKLNEEPFTELSTYLPNSPYAASKAASNHLVRSFQQTFGLPTTISISSNNYGFCQFPEKLIPLIILNAKNGYPLPIYGNGEQVRDWLFVTDHCEAILTIIENGEIGETYNIGGENEISNISIVKEICRYLDRYFEKSPHFPHEKLITHIADRPGHDFRYALNNSKIRTQLGWFPKTTLSIGLEKTIKWYLDNEKWIQKVKYAPNGT